MTPLLAVALTIAIELPLALLLIRKDRPRGLVRDVVLLNLFTNPLANWAVAEGLPFLGVEALVVFAESLIYILVSGLRPRRAVPLALVTNVVSASVGLLIS